MKRHIRNALVLLGFCSSGAWAACNLPTEAGTCLSNTINTTLDVRFGLHLHRNTWTLNLSGNLNTGGGATDSPRCYRAGFHNFRTGRDERYVRTVGSTTNFLNIFEQLQFGVLRAVGDSGPNDPANPYDIVPPRLEWAGGLGSGDINSPQGSIDGQAPVRLSSYPGFVVNSPSTLAWKGPMMCAFQTIVQKFSNNAGGYRLTAKLTVLAHNPSSASAAPTSFPDLVLREYDPTDNANQTESSAFILNNLSPANNGPSTLSFTPNGGVGFANSTDGWLDGHMLLALVLDGREQAGTYTATLEYNLFTP